MNDIPNNSRQVLDLPMSYIFSTVLTEYSRFNFYGHILSQCKITIDPEFKGIAGVRFFHNYYELKIGTEFASYTLDQQVGILVHESMHILYNHVGRKHDRDHYIFNIASDCAINQQITRRFLGDIGVFPDTLSQELGIHIPENLSAERYYDLIYDNIPPCPHCNGTGKDEHGKTCEHCDGSGKNTIKKYILDDHDEWDTSEGEESLRKAITKTMIERSIANNRGLAPANISEILELYEDNAKVSWRKELKDIIGNRRANKTRTIMRPNRRQPHRIELKGHKKATVFTVIAICDVSGSMDNTMILNGLNELHHICSLTGVSMKLIQVDTEVHAIEDFDKNTKLLNRAAAGGTIMEPAIDYIYDNKIEHDVIVLITDAGIENISSWKNPPRCKMIFLVTTNKNIPGIDHYPGYKQFNISDV